MKLPLKTIKLIYKLLAFTALSLHISCTEEVVEVTKKKEDFVLLDNLESTKNGELTNLLSFLETQNMPLDPANTFVQTDKSKDFWELVPRIKTQYKERLAEFVLKRKQVVNKRLECFGTTLYEETETGWKIIGFNHPRCTDKPSTGGSYLIVGLSPNEFIDAGEGGGGGSSTSTGGGSGSSTVISLDNDFLNAITADDFNIDNDQDYDDLTEEEKTLVKIYPVEAYLLKKNKSKAYSKTLEFFGRNSMQDCSDAFRHAYFNAINARNIGVYKAKRFGDAHESEVPAHLGLEKEMDLFNNNVGYTIYTSNNSASEDELATIVFNALKDERLKYLSPINYSDPCFFKRPGCTRATHGIDSNSKLVSTDSDCI